MSQGIYNTAATHQAKIQCGKFQSGIVRISLIN